MKDLKLKKLENFIFKDENSNNIRNDTTAATQNKTKEKLIPLNLLGPPSDCILCQKKISGSKLPSLMHGAQYRKYSGDLDSCYLKEIRNILKQRKSRSFIWFIESCIFDDSDEYLHSWFSTKKSIQSIYMYGLKNQNKVLQPKICIEKYEKLHCFNYHKKMLQNYKASEYQNHAKRNNNYNQNKKPNVKKSYTEILAQLTFQQKNHYNNFDDNGAGSFLFDSKKNSQSTIFFENETNINTNCDIILPYSNKSPKKMSVKELLKSGEKSGSKKSMLNETLSLSISEIISENDFKPKVLHNLMQDQQYNNSKSKDYKYFVKINEKPKKESPQSPKTNNFLYESNSLFKKVERDPTLCTSESYQVKDPKTKSTDNLFMIDSVEINKIRKNQLLKICQNDKLLMKKQQPAKISTDAMMLTSKQSTPPRNDYKKLSILESTKSKIRKNKELQKLEINIQSKSVKGQTQRKMNKKDINTIKFQKQEIKKSPSIKVWSNLDQENKIEYNSMVSRSLDPKHKSSKSEAIELTNKKKSNTNSGNLALNKQGLTKKCNSKLQSSDINAKILFQLPFQNDPAPEAKFITIDANSDLIFKTANSSKSRDKKSTSTKRQNLNSYTSNKIDKDTEYLSTNSLKILDNLKAKNLGPKEFSDSLGPKKENQTKATKKDKTLENPSNSTSNQNNVFKTRSSLRLKLNPNNSQKAVNVASKDSVKHNKIDNINTITEIYPKQLQTKDLQYSTSSIVFSPNNQQSKNVKNTLFSTQNSNTNNSENLIIGPQKNKSKKSRNVNSSLRHSTNLKCRNSNKNGISQTKSLVADTQYANKKFQTSRQGSPRNQLLANSITLNSPKTNMSQYKVSFLSTKDNIQITKNTTEEKNLNSSTYKGRFFLDNKIIEKGLAKTTRTSSSRNNVFSKDQVTSPTILNSNFKNQFSGKLYNNTKSRLTQKK